MNDAESNTEMPMAEFQVMTKHLIKQFVTILCLKLCITAVFVFFSLVLKLSVSPLFKPYTLPEPDSTRDDLQYYEHDTDPHDDWIVRTKKEWSGLPRIATHPLDLAVLRLANLERNIERRYLKEPLWNPAEVMRLAPLTPTPGEEHPMDVIRWEEQTFFGAVGGVE